MDKIREGIRNLAISKGVAPIGIKVPVNVKYCIYIVEGFLVEAPVYFVFKDTTQAVLSRLGLLNFEPNIDQEIKQKLEESWMVWNKIDPTAKLQFEDQTVLLMGLDPKKSEAFRESYQYAQQILDLFAFESGLDFQSVPSLVESNSIFALAAGVIVSLGKVEIIKPHISRLPPAVIQPLKVDLSPYTNNNEVVKAFERALHWRRRSRLATNLIDKFLYQWVSIESTLPSKRKYKRAIEISKELSKLWGENLAEEYIKNLQPELAKLIDNALNNRKRKVKKLVDIFHARFRSDIIHIGDTDLETDLEKRKELIKSIYRLNILSVRCCHLLKFAIEKGITRLDTVWGTTINEYLIGSMEKIKGFISTQPFEDFDNPDFEEGIIKTLYI